MNMLLNVLTGRHKRMKQINKQKRQGGLKKKKTRVEVLKKREDKNI